MKRQDVKIKFDFNYYEECFITEFKTRGLINGFKKSIRKTILKGIQEIFHDKANISKFDLYVEDYNKNNFANLIDYFKTKGIYCSCMCIDFISELEIKSICISKPFPMSTFEKYGNGTFFAKKRNNLYYFQINSINFSSLFFKCLPDNIKCNCSNLEPCRIYNLLAFQCIKCGKLYMCECQKQYYEIIYNYYKNELQRKDICTYDSGDTNVNRFVNLYEKANYKTNICYICKNEVPPPLYGYAGFSDFRIRYEPYISAIIDAYYIKNHRGNRLSNEDYNKVAKNAENQIRQLVGYPLIGEKYINETMLYKICCNIFNNHEIIREYSPPFLEKLRIDIYIPHLNLGIEYQGKQHFQPIKYFGGEDSFKKGQERDKKKKELCKKNGIKLIYFDYTEELTEDLVIKKIKRFK